MPHGHSPEGSMTAGGTGSSFMSAGHSPGGGSCPGNISCCCRSASATKTPISSLRAARMPSITHGKWSFQAAAPPLAHRAAFPLHHTVGLQVVGVGGDVLHPLLLTPISPHARGELRPPVSGDAGRQRQAALWLPPPAADSTHQLPRSPHLACAGCQLYTQPRRPGVAAAGLTSHPPVWPAGRSAVCGRCRE